MSYRPLSGAASSAPRPASKAAFGDVGGTVSRTIGTVQSSLLASLKTGAATAAADQYNQEISRTILAQLFPELAGDERIATLARLALPTLLVGLTEVFPDQFGQYGAQVRAAAELANDAAFRDVVQPLLPSLIGVVKTFAGHAPTLSLAS